MIIVSFVIAILSMIAVPQMIASFRNNRITTITASIASTLAEARLPAIQRTSHCSFAITPQTRRIWIEAGGVQIGAAEIYQSDLSISYSPTIPETEKKITFNSFGYLSTTPAKITVGNINQAFLRTVNISLSGKITVGQSFKPES